MIIGIPTLVWCCAVWVVDLHHNGKRKISNPKSLTYLESDGGRNNFSANACQTKQLTTILLLLQSLFFVFSGT